MQMKKLEFYSFSVFSESSVATSFFIELKNSNKHDQLTSQVT